MPVEEPLSLPEPPPANLEAEQDEPAPLPAALPPAPEQPTESLPPLEELAPNAALPEPTEPDPEPASQPRGPIDFSNVPSTFSDGEWRDDDTAGVPSGLPPLPTEELVASGWSPTAPPVHRAPPELSPPEDFGLPSEPIQDTFAEEAIEPTTNEFVDYGDSPMQEPSLAFEQPATGDVTDDTVSFEDSPFSSAPDTSEDASFGGQSDNESPFSALDDMDETTPFEPFGQEPSNPFDEGKNPYGADDNPFAHEARNNSTTPFDDNEGTSFGDDNPFGGDDNPFGGDDNPFADDDNPFGGDDNPFGEDDNPFGGDDNPFGEDDNPFANPLNLDTRRGGKPFLGSREPIWYDRR